ncbi:MAG: hypothetical protein HY906_26315 [Deltaproteobacteria bacterium]|nr:hypothetical protein [Deltaproteobacteria bacterium]
MAFARSRFRRSLVSTLAVLAFTSWLAAGCGSSPAPAGDGDAGADGPTGDVARDGGPGDGDPGLLSWVRVAPGGRYFATDDGRPFVPIGHQPGTGFLDLADTDIDAHFARMEAFGENLVRLDLDYFYGGADPRYVGLESSVGVFDPARVARIDTVFQLAAAHGIRILVVPWITSPSMWDTFDLGLNPYGVPLGGPAADPYEFLKSGPARAAFGRRLEWIAGRWGPSGTLFAWDLMNEADVLLNWSSIDDPESLRSWVLEIGNRVAAYEAGAHGRAHPRMVSWSSTVPAPAYSFLLDSPALDVAATHPYDVYGTNVLAPPPQLSLVEPALRVRQLMRIILGRKITDRRPYLENERNPNTGTMLRFHREADHNLAWAELASGAAGTGITWLEGRRPGVMVERHENLGPDRRALRDFVDLRVPAEFFLSDTIAESLDALSSPDAAVTVMSVQRGPHALGWMLGHDERCVQVECVNEVRGVIAGGAQPDPQEVGLAVLLWRALLLGEGVPLDDALFAALQAAFADRDPHAIQTALAAVLAYLEGRELALGTLAALAACPPLAPAVRFAMPPGDYRVDWIDDGSAAILRSDELAGGTATLTPPTFTLHLAVVVGPR